MTNSTEQAFQKWWGEVRQIAYEKKFVLSDDNPENYREYFTDGDDPLDTVLLEISAADLDEG